MERDIGESVTQIAIDTREESMATIKAYARIPAAFLVDRILRVSNDHNASTRWSLVEEAVASPFTKDYDALHRNRPTDWSATHDTRSWRVFAAFVGVERVGGAILITAPVAPMTKGPAVAELWDLRVHPAWRRRGVARALWQRVEAAVIDAKAHTLRVETQDVNVVACRFYAARGCALSSVEPRAYPALPSEVRLIWQKAFA